MINCDPVTGACLIPERNDPEQQQIKARNSGWAAHYVGDPMCSWCWGISPALKVLESYCAEKGIGFSVVVGGLRAGGGDPWNENFKGFLRKEWSHIHEVTGQPFGFTLLDAPYFNYDTEPACRAVVAARTLAREKGLPESLALSFFSAIQHKFYVEGKDPKVEGFYRDICEGVGLVFEDFCKEFASVRALDGVAADFTQCRNWSIRSFPSILLEGPGQVSLVAAGYIKPDALVARVEEFRRFIDPGMA